MRPPLGPTIVGKECLGGGEVSSRRNGGKQKVVGGCRVEKNTGRQRIRHGRKGRLLNSECGGKEGTTKSLEVEDRRKKRFVLYGRS